MKKHLFLTVFIAHICWRIDACLDSDAKNSVPPIFKFYVEDEDLRTFSECLLLDLGVESSTKIVNRSPNSAHYNHLNQQWDLRKKTVYPRAYFLPTTGQDVAEAVKCGIKANIHLIPNSGGHSFEGISWGTDDQIVVDFRNMNKVQLQMENGEPVAILEPGANLAQVIVHLWENGGYAASLGSCLTVGVGGHIIGGGVGWYSGVYGIGVDNMLEAEVVDGQGNLVRVNETINADLFWAIRGSGPGYVGILTQVKIKVFKASDTKMTLVSMRYSVKDFAQGFIALQNFQNWSKENDEKSGFLGFTITNDNFNQTIPALSADAGLSLAALHIQDPIHQPKGIENYLKAIKKFFPAPAQVQILNVTYLEHIALTAFAPVILRHPKTGRFEEIGSTLQYYSYAGGPLPDENKILSFFKMMRKEDAAPRYFKGKGFFTERQFTLEEMLPVQAVMQQIPQNIWILGVVQQGKMKRPRNETAYVHRDDPSIEITIHYEGSQGLKEVGAGLNFMYAIREAMQFMDSGESYQNTPDFDDKNYLQRYFKENLGKLIDIKAKWDPNNYFISKLSLPVNHIM